MRIYPFTHSQLNFVFSPSARDFVVREIPLYEPSNSGEHLMLEVRKKNLSTFEMLKILSEVLGIKQREIGYAGLKDKHAATYQFLSIPRIVGGVDSEKMLAKSEEILSQKGIKILSAKPHANKLKIGHLKGNKFFVRLKKVSATEASKIAQILKILQRGFPNYFGMQRFGNDGENYAQGEQILENLLSVRNKKIEKFLISAYQSFLFNKWLAKRVQMGILAKNFSISECAKMPEFQNLDSEMLKSLKKQCANGQDFLLLQGDVAMHYPFGKAFVIDDLDSECARFSNAQISPAGALNGKKLFCSKGVAFEIEKQFLDERLSRAGEMGCRRYAWVFPSEIACVYKKDDAHLELNFCLPKGAYATIFLEALKNENLS